VIHHLRAAGVGFILDTRGAAAPAVLHWGRDLGPLTDTDLTALADAAVPAVAPSSVDAPLRVSVLPTLADGWTGRPVLTADAVRGPGALTRSRGDDRVVETTTSWDDLHVDTRWELTDEGVLLLAHTVRNDGAVPVRLGTADLSLPLPGRARELVDFHGRWAAERRPQRQQPGVGVWLRETRHGRGGHDDPFLLLAGVPGFGFRDGEVWALHLAWSGDKRLWFERSELGATVCAAGEVLDDLTLAPGEGYTSPTLVATWSGAGIDGLSDRFHPWVRSWVGDRYPEGALRPRPVTLNTWEAVYFDHSLDRLAPLVDRAAEVGVERFVLDDGWFRGRTDDRRALGDWEVDEAKWPEGLDPLISRVHGAGMEFGLWVEPEMVSADSDLARAHPEWMLTAPPAVTWRWQHVLDLDHPDAWTHVHDRLDALLRRYPIAALKWDHNRDLLVPDTRRQVRALYRLIDALRAAHPTVEIESCASGGARIDLEMLRRVERFWPSDTNDPLERQHIQRWTGILIPPEHLGSHVGDARAHTTGRVSDLSFRLATALFLHAGIESDLTRLSDDEREGLRRGIAVHRALRPLLHTGRVVRADVADGVLVHGVVSADRREGVFCYAVLDRPGAAIVPPLAVPGLDPSLSYRVEVAELGESTALQDAAPPWFSRGARLSGAALAEGLLAMPLLAPGGAVVVRVRHTAHPPESHVAWRQGKDAS